MGKSMVGKSTMKTSAPTGITIMTVILAVVIMGAVVITVGTPSRAENDLLGTIKVPPGFRISLFAEGVRGARSMAMAPDGTVFLGSREGGRVYALRDTDGDHVSDRVYTLARNLFMPNGVAYRDGSLYVAEVNRVIRFDSILSRLEDPPNPVVVNDSFPSETHHGWKFIRFGPEGWLYVPVGAPCNVCESRDPRFATIMRMRPSGEDLEIFARGVRNTVGFDFHPVTGELWFTDNGRDWLGDDRPPDELNHAHVSGLHFGFPYVHGSDIADPEYGGKGNFSDFIPPVQELGPHVAALGMRFYDGGMFPDSYTNRIFIAEHGSWNRSVPIGYRITTVTLRGDRALRYEVFAEGWLQGKRAWGRPVDVLVYLDGSLLVSDDRAGAVYRISYGE
jgi:glucose/arabinose dehydrogenase